MTFSVGTTVGPYRIVDQIGQGGMATVFKAYHANLDRYVAFKVLHPSFKEDPTFLERFKREAQIVARLEHPAIVPVYDFAAHDGQPYLVMKFIEGETLKARLRRGPLTLDETLAIMTTVAAGLTHAHEQGILHRDIKPSNIMLDKAGTPYLADFGLARIAQAGESTMSQDMMLGTPQYISPEQAKGIYNLGPGTDIYSLGVVLYEIVVGRVPFSADTPYAIVHDHIYKPLPMPAKINPEVPSQVERVLLKALDKEPEGRYTSAVAMLDAFSEAVRAAGLTELSAARYRPPDASISASASTIPPGETPAPAVQGGLAPDVPELQAVGIPSPVTAADSTASRQRAAYRRRANLWMLGGVGALLLTCLASLFIIARAVSDPELQPWNVSDDTASAAVDDPPVPGQPPDNAQPDQPGGGPPPDVNPFERLDDLTQDEVAAWAAENPDDPLAHLMLALVAMRDGDREKALSHIGYAITELETSPQAAFAAAEQAARREWTELATILYLQSLLGPDPPPIIRNQAGEYLFEYAENNPAAMLTLLNQLDEINSESALTYTLRAWSLLQNERVLSQTQARRAVNAALDLNDNLAEAYLVRGIYWTKRNQPTQARADWEKVLDIPDAPRWARDQAHTYLENSE